MPWQSIADAGAAGPVSRTTLERRVAAGEIASMLDPATCKRLVWVGAHDPLEELLALVQDLAGQLGELRAELRASPARGAGEGRPGPVVADPPRAHDTAVDETPTQAPTATSSPRTSSLPDELDEVLARVDALGLADRDVERRAKLAVGFLSRARAGGKRGPQGKASRDKLAAFVAAAVAA